MTDLENFVNQKGRDNLVKDVRKKMAPNLVTLKIRPRHFYSYSMELI